MEQDPTKIACFPEVQDEGAFVRRAHITDPKTRLRYGRREGFLVRHWTEQETNTPMISILTNRRNNLGEKEYAMVSLPRERLIIRYIASPTV